MCSCSGNCNCNSATIPRGPQGLQGNIGPQGSQGLPGINGSTWHQGNTLPGSLIGVVGDYYFNTSNGEIFQKVSDTTWVLIADITGPQGNVGPAGPAGIIRLVSDTGTYSSTTLNTPVTLPVSAVIPANQLSINGDALKVTIYFTNTSTTSTQLISALFDSQNTTNGFIFPGFLPLSYSPSNIDVSGVYTIEMIRISSNQLRCYTNFNSIGNFDTLETINFTDITTVNGLDFTVTNPINIQIQQTIQNAVLVNGIFVDFINY